MPLPRTPSIRQLRRALPDKVVILPTAASRQVAQPQTREARQARQLARAAGAARFNHKFPGMREAERRAEAMQSADAGALIALAILETLDLGTRRRIIGRLEALAGKGPKYRQAADLAATTVLNFGEQWDLLKALEALAAPKGG